MLHTCSFQMCFFSSFFFNAIFIHVQNMKTVPSNTHSQIKHTTFPLCCLHIKLFAIHTCIVHMLNRMIHSCSIADIAIDIMLQNADCIYKSVAIRAKYRISSSRRESNDLQRIGNHVNQNRRAMHWTSHRQECIRSLLCVAWILYIAANIACIYLCEYFVCMYECFRWKTFELNAVEKNKQIMHREGKIDYYVLYAEYNDTIEIK